MYPSSKQEEEEEEGKEKISVVNKEMLDNRGQIDAIVFTSRR